MRSRLEAILAVVESMESDRVKAKEAAQMLRDAINAAGDVAAPSKVAKAITVEATESVEVKSTGDPRRRRI